ncbi:hypothetical protein BJI67_15685 [Acidihalobacter aeolianus]|uniref:Ribosomal RNA small subunit methyltransferase G n=1 Tax=Acidihalobacter aeolianus TaxID=2792603 RepID=A0A1D8KCK8_9GAMM|nr:hypothetical protein BJI67_15685 [Acidihalobacter aeolianus]
MEPAATASLIAGLEALGLDTGAKHLAMLQDYIALMRKWNRVHNLTAIEGDMDTVTHHLLDSLAIQRYLHGNRILDVGSGAGLPGIPLAIYQPSRSFTLLDASAKRVRFLRQCMLQLNLLNITPVHARVERYTLAAGFDTVVSRAFATLADFATAASHLLAPGGRLLAMKGRYPDEELTALPPEFHMLGVHTLNIPGMDAQRHLVEIGWEADAND